VRLAHRVRHLERLGALAHQPSVVERLLRAHVVAGYDTLLALWHPESVAKPGQEAIKSCIRRLSTYFLDAVFFAAFVAGSAAAALFAAHRFFVAAMIAALPAALSTRFLLVDFVTLDVSP
jgi:hypothetical protein